MNIFNCCECGKLVKDGVSGAQLSLCANRKHWQLGSGNDGYDRLVTRCYRNACAQKVAKQIVNAMYGANLPVTVEEKSDDQNE
ncbi:hypothetical protein [Dialister hominis]|uniref:hypothetical protein n=1 Tax=Dialister hominis TaxID=2582419 RepID=UPI003FF11C24